MKKTIGMLILVLAIFANISLNNNDKEDSSKLSLKLLTNANAQDLWGWVGKSDDPEEPYAEKEVSTEVTCGGMLGLLAGVGGPKNYSITCEPEHGPWDGCEPFDPC